MKIRKLLRSVPDLPNPSARVAELEQLARDILTTTGGHLASDEQAERWETILKGTP